jgi:hypothetical protein
MRRDARASAARPLTFLLLFLLAASAPAQVASWTPGQPGESLEIALVTVGPGQIYWERFGHNAILVRDSATGEETLYNYGIFDFTEENFFLNFMRGKMRYRIVGAPAQSDLAKYLPERRWIDVQALNLSPPQRVALRDFLEWNARPENAFYDYDYFLSNCSTKVRDALDRALGGALQKATVARSRGFTFRMHALRLTAPDFWLATGIHAGLGPFADRGVSLWEEMFVPMELEKHVRDVRVRDDAGNELPLVAAERRIAEPGFPDPSEEPPRWLAGYALAGIAIALLLALAARGRSGIARVVFASGATAAWLVAGFGGAVLLGLWLLTTHQSAWANENLLLFSPLALLLLPAAFRTRPGRFTVAVAWTVAALAGVALFVKVLPAFRQANLEWIALWLPVHLALAWSLARRRAAH